MKSIKKIEKIKIPKEPELEPGQIHRERIPLLEKAVKKINELVDAVNQLSAGYRS